MEFIDRVKEAYWPTDDDERLVREVLPELTGKVRAALEERGLPGEPCLVGSMAKGTYLSNPDADIFVLFPTDFDSERMGNDIIDVAREILDTHDVSYAQHPYAKGVYRGLRVDLVPAYKVESGDRIMSAVDRTPFHTRFVRERLDEEGREQVRLLKAFCKGIGVYSAEARVRGFSGYLLELMVIRYEDFLSVIDAACGWKRHTRVEMTPSPKDFDDPLVWIDPVDNGRNVASALSSEKFYRFIAACLQYREEPAPEFFLPRPLPPMDENAALSLLDNRGTNLLTVSLPRPDLVDDVLYPQMDKAEKAILKHLRNGGFSVLWSRTFAGERVVFVLELETGEQPAVKVHGGPPANHSNAMSFVRQWSDSTRALSKPYLVGSRWHVDVRRKERRADDVLRSDLENMSLGKDLSEAAKDGCIMVMGKDAVDALTGEELAEFFTREPPWMR